MGDGRWVMGDAVMMTTMTATDGREERLSDGKEGLSGVGRAKANDGRWAMRFLIPLCEQIVSSSRHARTLWPMRTDLLAHENKHYVQMHAITGSVVPEPGAVFC